VAGLIQRLDEIARRLAIVLDQQDLHDATSVSGNGRWIKLRPRCAKHPGPEGDVSR
jgi:hypothetical protein